MRRKNIGYLSTFVVAAALVFVFIVGIDTASAKNKTIESYMANAIVVDGSPGGNSAMVTMNIYRWSTPDEEQELIGAIKEGADAGPRARVFPNALRKQKKTGYVFIAGETGYPLRYSEQNDTPNGRQIVLITDRPVTFSEVYAGSLARDYDVTIFVLYVDKGEGIASVGTEISWNDAAADIEVTNISSQPVKLTNIRKN